MKRPDKIRQDIAQLKVLADRWADEGVLYNVERDLMLDKLRHLYDAVLFAQTHTSLDEQPSEDEHIISVATTATAAAIPTQEPEQESVEDSNEEQTSNQPAPIEEPDEEIIEDNDAIDKVEESDEEILVLDDMIFDEEQTEEESEQAVEEQAEETEAVEEFEEVLWEDSEEISEEPITEDEEPLEEVLWEESEEITDEPTEPTIEQAEEADTEPETESEIESEIEIEPESEIIIEKPEEPVTEQETESEIVEIEEPIQEQTISDNTLHQQSNLFDIDTYTAPRRSHRRLMSLYDDDLFEQGVNTSKSATEPIISEVVVEEQTSLEECLPQEEPLSSDASVINEDFAVSSPSEPLIEEEVIEEISVESTEVDSPIESYTIAEEQSSSDEIAIEEVSFSEVSKNDEQEESAANERLSTEPQTVLGDVMMNDKQILGDSIAASQQRPTTADIISHASINTLREALGINDRYTIISELFGGNEELCDKALTALDEQESLEDAIIFIESNFSWHPSSEAAAMIMEILERKFS